MQATQTAADQVQQVVAQLEETHQRLDDEIDARKALTAEAAVKAARLARLEGKSSSAQQPRVSVAVLVTPCGYDFSLLICTNHSVDCRLCVTAGGAVSVPIKALLVSNVELAQTT